MSSTATSAAKQTKKVSKKEEVVAPVATPAPVAAAVTASAAAPKKSTKKETAPVAATPVAAAPAPSVVAAPVETSEAPVVSVQDDVKAMLTQASTVRETVGALVSELKRLEKRVAKLQKEADKRRRKSKKPVEGEEVVPRKPSIFEVPTGLSSELCSFLGLSNGSKESRSNVTKAITTYVKEHNLKNKHNITPDAKLKSLLGVKDGELLTYFNLQRYLNRHYLKATPAVAATATA
jgi:chromatin remodeling complex protein RSC6